MADESIVIDIKAQFTDNATAGAQKAQKALSDLEKTAKQLSGKKHSVRLEVEDKASTPIKNVKKEAENFASKEYKSNASITDKASAVISKIKTAASNFASKAWKGTITFLDKASNIITKVEAAAKGFAGKVWKSTLSVVDKFTSPLQKLKSMLTSINTLIAAVATGLATKLVVAEPVSYADSMTNASIAFETMLGSSAASDKMMSDIMNFAKVTPFDTLGVISSTQQMMAFGFEANSVLGYMEKIGNVMAAMGKGEEGIDSVTRALGQMRATGRVNAQDMLQLTSVGIKAWDYVAEGMGKSVAEVRKMSEDGELAADDAIQHIMKGLEEFDGMMDKMSTRTVSGLWSNIKDTFQQSVVLDWGEGLQKGAVQGLTDMRDMLDRIDPLLQAAGTSLADIGENLSTEAFDLLNDTLERLAETLSSEEFQNADSIGEKIKIVWDEVIWEPFSEWWEGTGKPKFAEALASLGESVGEGISNALLTLLGVDVTDSLDDGVSLGKSLAAGLKEGFDGEAVGQALLDAIKRAFSSGGEGLTDMLLPGDQGATAGDKILGAGLAIGGTYLAAKGIVAADSAYKFLTPIVGSAAAGTGIAGGAAKVGTALTAGKLAGGTAAAVGLGAVAGGFAGGAALVDSGLDYYAAYKAYKADDQTELEANIISGSTKLTGVAAGAGIGFMIGGPAGALIGAGIGGVAGWLGGDYLADKIREDAEQLERETMAARYNSQEMKDAIMDSESSAEELAHTFNKVVTADVQRRFGDIKLKTSEIASIAQDIVFGENTAAFDNFASAAAQAESSLANLKASVANLNKTNWKLDLGLSMSENGQIELSAEEQANLRASIEQFVASAQQYVEDQNYEFTAAVGLLLDTGAGSEGAGIIANGNAFYAQIQEELQTLGEQLSAETEIALSDGVLTLDEQAELTNLQQQIANITNMLAQAETAAEFAVIKVKFGKAELSDESFAELQAQLQEQVAAATAQYDEALTAAITTVELQVASGALDRDAADEQIQTLVDGYNGNIDELNAQVANVQLEILADAYSDVLPEDALASLQNALNEAIKTGVDPIEWTAEETSKLLGLEGLTLGEEVNTSLTGFLSQVAASMAEQVQATDFSGVGEAVSAAVGESFSATAADGENAGTMNIGSSLAAATVTDVENADFTEVGQVTKSKIDESVATAFAGGEEGGEGSSAAIGESVVTSVNTSVESADFSVVGTTVINGVSTAITEADTEALDTAAQAVRTATETAVNNAFATPIAVTATVNITLDWNILNPTTTISVSGEGVSGSSVTATAVASNANGGFINGKTLSWLAEEGTPEVVIPLGSHRRGRAMDLWEKTGELLGVTPEYNAFGGIVGTTMSETPVEAVPISYSSGGGNGTIKVDVGGVSLTIITDGSGDVVSAIKSQKDAIVDVISEALYEALLSQFSNTPLAAR